MKSHNPLDRSGYCSFRMNIGGRIEVMIMLRMSAISMAVALNGSSYTGSKDIPNSIYEIVMRSHGALKKTPEMKSFIASIIF